MLSHLFLVIIAIQPAFNLPQPSHDLKSSHTIIQRHDIPVLKKEIRNKKGINIGYPLPIHHHLLLPSQLHVLPATSNVRQSAVHTGVQHIVTSNGHIPIYHQTVSHSSTNITHPTPLVPILVQFQHNVPVHDLSVIPLHRAQKFGQLREKKKADDREDVNQFRTFYGGYGTGLYFGGHGAGHGFYAYGKWSVPIYKYIVGIKWKTSTLFLIKSPL